MQLEEVIMVLTRARQAGVSVPLGVKAAGTGASHQYHTIRAGRAKTSVVVTACIQTDWGQ
jgi:hypothetical protein